jgi:U6 snRNA-associated Sm-like protein LSm7
MSEQRGRGRGSGGGRGANEHRGGRGGGRGAHEGGRGGHAAGGTGERPKKENILDLGKYMDKKITVKFTGGREGRACKVIAGRKYKLMRNSYWDLEGI